MPPHEEGRSPDERAAPELGGSTAILDPVAAYEARCSVVPITRADVAAAVALIPRQARSGLGMPFGFQHPNQSSRRYERERWYLSVSPGTVRVHSRSMAPKVTLWDDESVTMTDERPTRGAISEWSQKSRARMFSVLPSLDYEPMFATGGVAAMVTLTLPGEGWEQLVPDLATFKKRIDRFQALYARAWGNRPIAVWKMEFQRRGAPHLHLFMVPPTGFARGRGVKRDFSNWLSVTWAKVIGAPEGSNARRNHELAGTGIDYREGARFSDPRRIAAYFSKHGAYSDKEYQNEMPEHWRRAILDGQSGGAHFWGYWQLEKAIETVELRSPGALDEEITPHYVKYPTERSSDVVRVMRHLRKVARSRSYVKKVTVERWSVDERTGEVTVRRRKVNRRQHYLRGQRAGFLVVNDGPAAARDIARVLGASTEREGFQLVA